METILVLAHTEMDGSLGRPAREALAAARSLHARLNGSALIVGLVGLSSLAVTLSFADLAHEFERMEPGQNFIEPLLLALAPIVLIAGLAIGLNGLATTFLLPLLMAITKW